MSWEGDDLERPPVFLDLWPGWCLAVHFWHFEGTGFLHNQTRVFASSSSPLSSVLDTEIGSTLKMHKSDSNSKHPTCIRSATFSHINLRESSRRLCEMDINVPVLQVRKQRLCKQGKELALNPKTMLCLQRHSCLCQEISLHYSTTFHGSQWPVRQHRDSSHWQWSNLTVKSLPTVSASDLTSHKHILYLPVSSITLSWNGLSCAHAIPYLLSSPWKAHIHLKASLSLSNLVGRI